MWGQTRQKGMLSKCQASDLKKELGQLEAQPPAVSLLNSECILFCIYDSFVQRKKSTWMILEITSVMLAVITATVNNENNDSIFQRSSIVSHLEVHENLIFKCNSSSMENLCIPHEL